MKNSHLGICLVIALMMFYENIKKSLQLSHPEKWGFL